MVVYLLRYSELPEQVFSDSISAFKELWVGDIEGNSSSIFGSLLHLALVP